MTPAHIALPSLRAAGLRQVAVGVELTPAFPHARLIPSPSKDASESKTQSSKVLLFKYIHRWRLFSYHILRQAQDEERVKRV
jgi:hypothetical protein